VTTVAKHMGSTGGPKIHHAFKVPFGKMHWDIVEKRDWTQDSSGLQ
jgi:hypothetical protein